MLKKGDLAPLDIVVSGGASLRDYLGKYTVVYFYPKDDTPGCTVEACAFRDSWKEIQKMDINVLGVSADSEKSHQKFTEKFKLPFPLLADTEHKLCEAFGVWGEKKFMGKAYMGIMRTTFAIDPQGKILNVWENVKPEGHSDEVLGFLKEFFQQELEEGAPFCDCD